MSDSEESIKDSPWMLWQKGEEGTEKQLLNRGHTVVRKSTHSLH